MALQARLSIYRGSVDLEEIERVVEFWIWVVPSGWPTRKQGTVIQKLKGNWQMKITGQSKFKFEAMFAVLFDMKGVFLESWVPSAVNQHDFGEMVSFFIAPAHTESNSSGFNPRKTLQYSTPSPVHLNLEPGKERKKDLAVHWSTSVLCILTLLNWITRRPGSDLEWKVFSTASFAVSSEGVVLGVNLTTPENSRETAAL